MLMKYIQVTESGEVKGLQNKSAIKYAYGSMLNLRVQLTNSFAILNMITPSVHLQSIFESMKVEKKE